MAEVMNFFQSMFTFKNAPAAGADNQEGKSAISLQREARSLAAKADEEMRNGRAAKDLMDEVKDKAVTFAGIAFWHTGRAVEKYRQAAGNFEEAGRVQPAKRNAFDLMTKEMTRRAAEAEASVNLLKDFLEQSQTKQK